MFHKMKQEPQETVAQHVARMRVQAQLCEYRDANDINENIRDHLVDTCRSVPLRKKLLEKGSALTLDKALQLARTMEAVDQQTAAMSDVKDRSMVNRVEDKTKAKTYGSKKRSQKCHNCGEVGHFAREGKCKTGKSQGQGSQTKGCYRCGRDGHFARDEACPARKATCRKCKLPGHFDVMCQTKQGGKRTQTQKKGHVNTVDESEEDEYAFTLRPNRDKCEALVDIIVDGVTISDMLIDSGTTCNIISKEMWQDMAAKSAIKLQGTRKRLYPYGKREPLQILGKFTAKLEVGSQNTQADFLVFSEGDRGLLGRATALKLGVLKLGPQTVNILEQKQAPEVQKYPELFEGLGKLDNYQVKIHIDDTVTPVAQTTRRIPFSLRDKLEQKLVELEETDVIERVEGPTPWVSPAVIVPKPSGDIRLCIDMRRANKVVVRERHPIPTIDEELHTMNRSTIFSKLDLRWGFHQLELAEESRNITTFSTHKGLYRYKRLIFGISAAPEIYQHAIQQVLAGCEGAQNISDDIIIHGRDMKDHDQKLDKVLQYLKKRGLTLNKEKCEFRMSKLIFMGKVLSDKGVGPTGAKVEAVVNAREPQNVSEVRSFLGLVNFNARFIPNLATMAEPLRRLTWKDTQFRWSEKEQTAFDQLKEALSRAETLAYFDKMAPTKVIADAGPVGLGAVLIQEQKGEQRVISYASRSLTDVERRYSQTKKEALALVWACERFHNVSTWHRFRADNGSQAT